MSWRRAVAVTMARRQAGQHDGRVPQRGREGAMGEGGGRVRWKAAWGERKGQGWRGGEETGRERVGECLGAQAPEPEGVLLVELGGRADGVTRGIPVSSGTLRWGGFMRPGEPPHEHRRRP